MLSQLWFCRRAFYKWVVLLKTSAKQKKYNKMETIEFEKIKITNSNQFEKLVQELERNPSLERGSKEDLLPKILNADLFNLK